MSEQFLDIFPLSIAKSKISISVEEKKDFIQEIFKNEKETLNTKKGLKDAWLGDTKGYEKLFKNPKFNNLANLIGKKVMSYTNALGIDNDKIDFFYQRSWATITRNEERITPHRHVQSNISFAYYPLKPKDSGNIRFLSISKNEIAIGIFRPGLVKNFNLRNTSSIDVPVEENDIIIFPSNTEHATIPNKSNEPRISISGDIVIMLKEKFEHKRFMTHFENWQEF